jgi:FtsZ-binding cell division protein ZapB
LEALKEKESTRISEVDMQKEANKNLTDEIKKLKDKLQTVNEHNDNLIHKYACVMMSS